MYQFYLAVLQLYTSCWPWSVWLVQLLSAPRLPVQVKVECSWRRNWIHRCSHPSRWTGGVLLTVGFLRKYSSKFTKNTRAANPTSYQRRVGCGIFCDYCFCWELKWQNWWLNVRWIELEWVCNFPCCAFLHIVPLWTLKLDGVNGLLYLICHALLSVWEWFVWW